jgi:predicted nucleotide-binding protein (sugar kinase/HSP70/actin superfamily)
MSVIQASLKISNVTKIFYKQVKSTKREKVKTSGTWLCPVMSIYSTAYIALSLPYLFLSNEILLNDAKLYCEVNGKLWNEYIIYVRKKR